MKIKIHGNATQPIHIARKTVLSYGQTRSGKTRFAATWPRPAFLSDVTESGWTTIESMDPELFFEPDRPPEVYPIAEAVDVMNAIAQLKPRVESGEIMTVVFDSLTFYNDLYFNYIYKMAPIGKPIDTRELYGKLAKHLMEIRIQVHSLKCNVIWLCLVKETDETHPEAGPMITGQSAQKFPAGCDFIFYHRQVVNPTGNSWEIRTRKFNAYVAGGRDEGRLPNPLEPTYQAFSDALELANPLDRFKAKPQPQPVRRPVAPPAPPVRR